MPRRNKGHAFADEYRHDSDDELLNRALIEEGADDLASTHHPDVLASCLRRRSAKTLIDWLTNSTPIDADAGGGRRENT